MRYFPARVVPISESSVFSSAMPSAGQRVVASDYSTPHCGHFFISWLRLSFHRENASLSHPSKASQKNKNAGERMKTLSPAQMKPSCSF
jgi:hypothetical protein